MKAPSPEMETGERTRVLFVDDEPLVLEGLRRAVYTEFVADLANGPEEGLAKLRDAGPYPIVVSDMRMPGMDGATFLGSVRKISPASIRVMLTGAADVKAAGRAVNEGRIFRFLTKPITRETLVTTLLECRAEYRSACLAEDYLRETLKALEQSDLGTLTSLARVIDARSAWTAGHSERVASTALSMAQAMGMDAHSLKVIRRGAMLHDIGKIGTPASILDKPAALDAQETQIMRDHVQIGVRIIEPIPCLHDALPMVAQHHKWFDGSGYPAGAAGQDIDLRARILAIADCYDAMVSDRPYRKGLTPPQAIQTLQSRSGTQFDPQILEIFMRLIPTAHEVHDL
jgi:putative two-component system response regulator